MNQSDIDLITSAGLTRSSLASILDIKPESVYKWATLPLAVRLYLEERINRGKAEDSFRYLVRTLKDEIGGEE